jgi:hypothetical protein
LTGGRGGALERDENLVVPTVICKLRHGV